MISLESLLESLVQFAEHLGYPGIFLLTLLESTFLPIPAEITMIPAGYLVYTGHFNPIILFFCSLAGSVSGAYVNYWLAMHYGRKLFIKYGKLFMLTPEKLAKIENYFVEHGAISVFTGRLLPGVKHYISFPAGLARMPLKPFLIYATLSGAIWMGLLIVLGYLIGQNEAALHDYLRRAKELLALFAILVIGIYSFRAYRRKKRGS